jgi:hypothetical protein
MVDTTAITAATLKARLFPVPGLPLSPAKAGRALPRLPQEDLLRQKLEDRTILAGDGRLLKQKKSGADTHTFSQMSRSFNDQMK